ncbi:MAG: hypothetical protein OXC00_06965, partial [Acidimicrobiaceae bacterium]|nr:hypothetical protein [Acidimicrobiaceae bacterium]
VAPRGGPPRGGAPPLQRWAIAARAGGRLPDDRFFALPYADLLADPAGAIGAAYERFGWPVPAALPGAVTAYLAAKPKAAKGRHRYSPEAFGLTAARIRDEFADYIDRFAIAAED